jgi:hypothetical protein
MATAQQFKFEAVNSALGQASYMPMLPMALSIDNHTVKTSGLIDTGSSVNVMPYDVGVQLGAIWEDLNTPIKLTGNLASHEARSYCYSTSSQLETCSPSFCMVTFK